MSARRDVYEIIFVVGIERVLASEVMQAGIDFLKIPGFCWLISCR